MYQEQLNKLKKEQLDIESQLSSPSLSANPEELKKLSKRYSLLKQRLSIVDKIYDLENKIKANQLAITKEQEEDLKILFKEELTSFNSELESLINELNDLDNPNKIIDKLSVIMEIRAGTGGEEAALFVSDLFKMYSGYSTQKNWSINILSQSFAQQGGFKELIFEINGNGVFGKLKNESGVHRVQRIPETENAGRIHTSAASVVVLPQIEADELEIKNEDIKVDVYRASGPGGQGVNTTDSAVRITHIPTQIVITCQEGRSQIKNKEKALSILRSRLFQLERENKQKSDSLIRKDAIKGGDRSDKIKTYNFPQNRLTDHRIKKSWYQLTEILQGDIDQIVSIKLPN